MDYHQNARLLLRSREPLARKVVLDKYTLKQAVASFNVSAKTCAMWVSRYRGMGHALSAIAVHSRTDYIGPLPKSWCK